MHACRVSEITELRRPATPGKEPKLSDLGVTRRNPDTVRDSEGPSGTVARALFPAGGTGLTTPGGHGTLAEQKGEVILSSSAVHSSGR
jgi:hypothetical protein